MDKKMIGTVLVEGISLDEYVKRSEQKLNNLEQFSVEADEENKYGYLKLNNQRINLRVKSFTPSDESLTFFGNLKEELVWMVLVADWCGDCAQNLPVISSLAGLSDKVHLKLIPRDQYPQIMDNYLTNGARSIPKLVVMKADGTELFSWGDKPKPAAELVAECKKDGMVKEQILEKLHHWYGKDRGKTTEAELVQLLRTHI